MADESPGFLKDAPTVRLIFGFKDFTFDLFPVKLVLLGNSDLGALADS